MKGIAVPEHLKSIIISRAPRLKYWYHRSSEMVKRHPLTSLITGIFIALFILPAAVPHQGKILPVDPYMVTAYSMLSSTKSGRQLIKRVKRSTAGSYIYLSLGSTERDRLTDYYGDTVRGVTRATYQYIDRLLLPKSVTVITNRDLVGTAPRDIIRSIAFELENVDYSFRNPQFDFSGDSPFAERTQQRVLEELDM
jgi:hypothetical protein